MTTSIEECEAAMKNVDIDDDALVKMFRGCDDSVAIVDCAVRSNNERAVRLLIAENFDLSDVDEYGCTFLHDAYKFASLRVVDMLLAAGLTADAEDDFGTPPWHYAALNRDESVMAHLIASGIDVHAANFECLSLVHRAACNENDTVLAMLIAAGADIVVRDELGHSPCHLAAKNPNAAVIKMLIPSSDVNAVNDDNETPCIWAADKKNARVLELLIGAGANVHAVANAGDTALSVAVRQTDDKSIELLVDAGADVNKVDRISGQTAMHVAARRCNHRLLRKLIAAGGNVNAKDNDKQTPLHMLMHADKAKADDAMRSMAMLIAAEADVNARDKDGRSPLHVVAKVGLFECVSLLLKAGANVQAQNSSRETALFWAKDLSVVALLIAANVSLNAANRNGLTACHSAYDSARVVSLLLAAGANPHLRDNQGETALHRAARDESCIDTMTLLIDAGVDVNQRDIEGDCAGHMAARTGCVGNLKLLLAHGVDVNQRNDRGQTMLKLAAAAPNNCVQSVRLLIDAGADVHVTDNCGASAAHGANALAFPLLRSLGVDLNGLDVAGNTPCHAARNVDALTALFALGANMTAPNNAGGTRYDWLVASAQYVVDVQTDDFVLTLVAAGVGFGVQTQLKRAGIAAVVIAGGGLVSARANAAALLAHEGAAISRIFKRQRQLFRLRALEVCMGLQSLRVSALELCEILAHMFAPLESLVPFDVAWRVVTKVKHFKR